MKSACKNISCFIIIWNDSKTKDKNPINGFLQLDLIALENLDEKHEQTSDQKLRKRKYWFIYPKKSEADNRLIDSKDNTPTHIILTTDDLITEKAKNQKNLDVVLSWFVGNKDNTGLVNVRGKKEEELLK